MPADHPPPPHRPRRFPVDGNTPRSPHPLPPRLDALTPLRFVAAALIVIGHAAPLFGWVPGAPFLFAANAGVSLFFVLSGYVLGYNYPALDDRAAVGRFLALRFARIWPLHAAVLLATILLFPTSRILHVGIDPWLAALASFALLQSWIPIAGYSGAYNGPAWTLSVDVFFYAAFPLLLAPVRLAPWRSLALAFAVSLAPPLLANAIGGPRADLPLDQVNWYTLDHFFPPARLVEFVLGMVAARAYSACRPRLPAGIVAATALEAAALALTAISLAGLPKVPRAAIAVGPGVADWLAQIAAAPAFALLFIALSPGRGAVSRILSTRGAVHLGDLSYATYLVHAPLASTPVWLPLVAAIGAIPAALAFAAALLALAHLAWRGVELPARRAIVGAYDRRARRAAGDPRVAPSDSTS